ncbi:hypothetical protein MMC26_002178 [Xylographa opegraphella]|nr:hypothetical protein [Xylographa opegraphella]
MTSQDSSTTHDFSWSISLDVDSSADASTDSFLSSRTTNTAEEESIPREIIAEEVRSTRFQAELERPILIGTFNDQLAFLLCFKFSFQRLSHGFLKRIQMATMEITFDDAPSDRTVPSKPNPCVVRHYPIEHQGAVSTGTVSYYKEVNAQVSSIPYGPTFGTNISTTGSRPQEGRLVVHGVTSGRQARNRITWTVEENDVLQSGMPREMKMALVVNMKEERRFSARVIVTAHYAFNRGLIAKMIPVIGKSHDPLYFDPAVLRDIAQKQAQTGLDGRPIAKNIGPIDNISLSEYTSFPDRRED